MSRLSAQLKQAPSAPFAIRSNQPSVRLQTKRPTAPKVYRPQSPPNILQPKASVARQKSLSVAPRHPVGPPVYRPQQRDLIQPKSVLQSRKAPAAPPVYRPEPNKTVQPKTAPGRQNRDTKLVPPISLTRAKVAQMKPAGKSPSAQSTNGHAASSTTLPHRNPSATTRNTIQRMIGFEYEVAPSIHRKIRCGSALLRRAWVPHEKGEVIMSRSGYDITADSNAGGGTNIEFITKPIDETMPANITRLRAVARSIYADIVAIYNGSVQSTDPDDWVGANQVPRLNGWWWHRFQNRARNWNAVSGQLQMTGGVRLSRLSRVLSGSALGQEGQGLQGDAEIKRRQLTKFYAQNPAGAAKQPIWQRALNQVNAGFATRAGWVIPVIEEMFASVVAMMAQVPIEKRGGFPNDNSGLLLAKTDYSKILHMIVERVGRTIPEAPFLTALLNTVNHFIPANEAVNGGSDIFPNYYIVQGTNLQGLTFRDWVEMVLPEIDPLAADSGELEFMPGIDQMTKKDFPGTAQQNKEMRAFGTFGSKVDPGGKVIMEFRNFTSSVPEELEAAMAGIAEYLGTDVNG